MADIFVSYTSSDRDWAFWIGQELEKLGHVARLHDWEITAGGDIARWMEERHDSADHILCVVSEAYLKASYSSWERRAAQWAAVTKRPNFTVPVFIEPCEPPTLLAPIKRCDLHGLEEPQARERLAHYLKPAAKPAGPVAFPGARKSVTGGASPASAPVRFPGISGVSPTPKQPRAISNIPIRVPTHFVGRDDDLSAIDKALNSGDGRAAISALHGLRGVGKTTLAAAYAERHRDAYRATWWIRAETEPTLRADLVGLGVQMGWVAADAAEEPAMNDVLRRLASDGESILLIYDNAKNPNEVDKLLPRGGKPHIIVTSNAPNWGRIAAPVEIEVWPQEIGADFLIARTGRKTERDTALALSEALGGLPLAHDQAAAYCERVGISITEYKNRFDTAPANLLDNVKDASLHYHNGLTVAKTFTLAIGEAAKLHPAAEPLIVYASLLAPEPIPLYLFSEGREKFSEPFASGIAGESLDEAVAALRAFGLVDREAIPDERNPVITTDCIRLHRLVRQVAVAGHDAAAQANIRRELIEASARACPDELFRDPATWPRMRRLDTIALALVEQLLPDGTASAANYLLNQLATFRQFALAAYTAAQPLYERALAVCENALGPNHGRTAITLNNLGALLRANDDLVNARLYVERALEIREQTLGPDHRDTAQSLNTLGSVLQGQGDFLGARSHYARALAIREKELGANHPDTAVTLSNLGVLSRAQGNLAEAQRYHERALAIREIALGPDQPETANSINNLGYLYRMQGDPVRARSCYERALAIREKALGSEHPQTAISLHNLGFLLLAEGDPAGARPYLERGLNIRERKLGLTHPKTRRLASSAATVLDQLSLAQEAAALRQKFGVKP